MTLDIKFNDYDILKGHLKQSIEGTDFELGRFTVGSNGGLAYHLFQKEDWQEFPISPKMGTLKAMDALRTYIDTVDDYINAAGKHAAKFEFGLVTSDGVKITPEFNEGSHAYSVGMGDVSIESVERFARFLEMVKSGQGDLLTTYGKVQEKAKAVEGSKR